MISKRPHLATRPWIAAALLVALAAAGAASPLGCGREEEGGGEITVSQAEGHRLDPAFAYRTDNAGPVEASEPLSLVYTPLLAYRREEGMAGSELIPGLARSLPEVSDNGRTYTLALRKGLEYSNGTEVRARDFEHTVKRVLRAGSDAAAFFERVEGAAEYLAEGDPAGDIRGIRTDDRTGEIVIELTEPDASFANALAMWFAAPVPSNTSFRDRSADPPPGVGPYEIAESVPGRRFVLEKSETFPTLAIPDIPTGNVDRITAEIGDGSERQAEGVLGGRLDYMQDPAPESVRSQLISDADERYQEWPAPSTLFAFLNPQAPPFDDPRVRQAVNYAVDRAAVARSFPGGLESGCSLLPPNTPGYDEALDTTECPYGDPSRPPDIARARQLVETAGDVGTAVTVWETGVEELDGVVDAYVEALVAIGLDVGRAMPGGRSRPTELPRDAQTGVVWWFEDYPHPLNIYSLLATDAAGPLGAPALPDLGDPRIDRSLDRLNLEPELDEVAEEWAALDRYVVSPPQSYVVPLGHPRLSTLMSERMDPDTVKPHPVYLNDYSSFALAPGDD